jgi:hypothetical protein
LASWSRSRQTKATWPNSATLFRAQRGGRTFATHFCSSLHRPSIEMVAKRENSGQKVPRTATFGFSAEVEARPRPRGRAQRRFSGPNWVVEPSRHPSARLCIDLRSRWSPNVRLRVKKALNGHLGFSAEVKARPRPRGRAQRRFSGPNGVVEPSRHPFARLRSDLRSRRSPNVRIRVKKALNRHLCFSAEVEARPRPRGRAQRRFSGPNGVVEPSRHPFARLRIDLRSRRSPNTRIRVKKALNRHLCFSAEVEPRPWPRGRAQRRFSGPNKLVEPSRHPFARLRSDLRSRRSPNVRFRVKKCLERPLSLLS